MTAGEIISISSWLIFRARFKGGPQPTFPVTYGKTITALEWHAQADLGDAEIVTVGEGSNVVMIYRKQDHTIFDLYETTTPDQVRDILLGRRINEP